jgi:hypothetical protein
LSFFIGEMMAEEIEETPLHPYWCDDCGNKSAFTIPGCEIDHDANCPRTNEDAMEVYRKAVDYCQRTGKGIS